MSTKSGTLQLAPHPDVLEALQFLTKSGVRIIALTNCGAATVERLFTSHELDSYIEKVISMKKCACGSLPARFMPTQPVLYESTQPKLR